MVEYISFALLSFTSLFAMVDPIGVMPIYLSATSRYDRFHRAATVKTAIVTALLIMCAFALLGNWIFRLFGFTAHAFRVAGGIVLFRVGVDMLEAKRSRVRTSEEEEKASAEKDDIGIIPLGFPLLAGPGALTTIIALISQSTTWFQQGIVYFAIFSVLFVTFLILTAAPQITRDLGPNGMMVIERIMALIVMVIGVQFIMDGVEGSLMDFIQKAPISALNKT